MCVSREGGGERGKGGRVKRNRKQEDEGGVKDEGLLEKRNDCWKGGMGAGKAGI